MTKLAFLFCFSMASVGAAHKNAYDYIYKLNNDFYDQSGLDQAVPDELEAEFLRRKQHAYRSVVFSSITPAIGGLAVYSAVRLWPRRVDAVEAAVPRNAGFGAFALFFSTVFARVVETITQPYTLEIQESITGFINSFERIFTGPPKDEVHQLEIQYVRKKPQLSSRAHQAIEWHFEKIRKQYPMGIGQFTNPKEDPALTFLRQALALPVYSRSIEFDPNQFNDQFAQYAEMMSLSPLDELKRFSQSLVRASRHENPKFRSSLYLVGPPGVGKTEAILKLGKVLQVPVIKINLAEFQNIGQLKGSKCEYIEDTRCGPGFIASQLIELAQLGQSSKNAILFFDEADQVLNRMHEGQSNQFVSFMLDLLEGRTHFLDNPYFGFDIDVRNFGFVLAGNNMPDNKALLSRLDILPFGNYRESYRIKIGRQRFLPEILEGYHPILKLSDFTAEDFETIDAIAKKEHLVLQTTGEDPGFRNQIRELERFVHQKAVSPSALSSAN